MGYSIADEIFNRSSQQLQFVCLTLLEFIVDRFDICSQSQIKHYSDFREIFSEQNYE